MTEPVRVRIAPSPTGDVHIGTIWIAQFGWVFARQHHGTFVLRIEDTDRERLVPGSVDRIYEALEWYGLTPDEGPKQGGPHGPYVQSERLPLYREHAMKLIEQGNAYYCFCTVERLAELRAQQASLKQSPRYDKRCLAIPPDEARRRADAGEPHVVRLNVPSQGTVEHRDLVRGNVTFALRQIDDSVLMKSDGFPTYHLAVVVDDHHMKISHIIRAEEWLPSVPKHLLIYKAFGWDLPAFAHMPMILGTDRKKLSKRHGATSALSFRDEGYLPEAMKNFLVLMGWRPKGDTEIFPMDVVLKQFRLEDVNPAGAIFDRTKLDWMNGAYLRALRPGELVSKLNGFWHVPDDARLDAPWREKAVRIVQDRMRKLSDIDGLVNVAIPTVWDASVAAFDRSLLIPKRGTAGSVAGALEWTVTWIDGQKGEWTAARMKETMLSAIAASSRKNLDVLWPLRVALTLQTASPDVFDVMDLIGRDETLRRIRHFMAT